MRVLLRCLRLALPRTRETNLNWRGEKIGKFASIRATVVIQRVALK